MSPIIIALFLMCIVFAAFVFVVIKVTSEKEQNIYTDGIEVDSVVSKCEHYFRDQKSRYRCYVKYMGNDNLEHEGLLNVRANLPIGRIVHIKYLPNRFEDVAFVSQ